jgi:hypothetical protein
MMPGNKTLLALVSGVECRRPCVAGYDAPDFSAHRSGIGSAMFPGPNNEVGLKLRFAEILHEQMEIEMNLSRSFRAMLRVLAFAGALSVAVVSADGAFARGGGGHGGGGMGGMGSTASGGNGSGGRSQGSAQGSSQGSATSGRIVNTIHPIIAGRGGHDGGGRHQAGRHEGGRHHARMQSRGRHFAHRGHHMRHRTASLR